MKKISRICIVVLIFSLLYTCSVSAKSIAAATAAKSTTAATAAKSAKSTKNGWKTVQGKTMYYKNGEAVTGFYTIGSHTYYFDAKGYLKKNAWFTRTGKSGQKLRYRTYSDGSIVKSRRFKINGKYYYFKASGVVLMGWKTFSNGKSYFGADGAAYTGIQKIDSVTYLFSSDGYLMKNASKKSGNTTYYTNESGQVEMKVVSSNGTSTCYDSKGKKMSGVKAQDAITLTRAKAIVDQITNSKMSQSQKLKACYDWVIAKPYVTRRKFSNFEGWPAVYANDHFVLGGGNCEADASAFAYLAKALGYTKIYVCTDSNGTSGLAHSWTEIDGKVYDPLFSEAKDYYKYYGVSYSSYGLHPILHIAI